MTNVEVIFRRAAQRIRFNGWRSRPKDKMGPAFQGWSLYEALTAKNLDKAIVDEALDYVRAQIVFLEPGLGTHQEPIDAFNNAPGRSKDEIITVLKAAALSAEGHVEPEPERYTQMARLPEPEVAEESESPFGATD